MCVFSAGNEYLWPFYSPVISLYIHSSTCKGRGGGGEGGGSVFGAAVCLLSYR